MNKLNANQTKTYLGQMKNVSAGFTLSGCILSKEDHGYIVSAGIPNYSFFVPLGNISDMGVDYVIGKSFYT